MQQLQVPQDIPYFGWLSPTDPFFFRPRCCPNKELESQPFYQQTSSNESLKDFPWSKHERVVLEYCSGNGHWIIEQAQKHPHWYWIALEKRLDRSKKILSKLRHAGINNLAIVCSEAKWFTRHFLLPQQLEAIFINFPDPWPKDKHQRHRLFEDSFVEQLVRVMKPQATLNLATDDQHYMNCAIEVMSQQLALRPGIETEELYKVIQMDEWGYSFFADLWRTKGRNLYRTQFIRENLG